LQYYLTYDIYAIDTPNITLARIDNVRACACLICPFSYQEAQGNHKLRDATTK
jgi:hypothetical protein